MIAIHFCLKRDDGPQDAFHRRFDLSKMLEEATEYNSNLWFRCAFEGRVADLPLQALHIILTL